MSLDHRIRAQNERLLELESFRDQHFLPLSSARFRASPDGPWQTLSLPAPWPERGLPIELVIEAQLPPSWKGKPLAVRLDLGGEGLLSVNGAVIGGLNPFHREHRIEAAGQTLSISAAVVPRHFQGAPIKNPVFAVAELLVPDFAVRSLHAALASAIDGARWLVKAGRFETASRVLDATERALVALDLPRSPTANYLSRLSRLPVPNNVEAGSGDFSAAHQLSTLWEEPRLSDVPPVELDSGARASIARAVEIFERELTLARAAHPTEGQLHIIGQAHIDVAWLWPIAETRRKAVRTFATAVSLMKQDERFVFAQSQAQLYRYVEEDAPEVFDQIRRRVAEGRWELVGGSWVEPDGNLTSGESWARQLLFGQKYFERCFGKRAAVAWLPDTFGYAGSLPQIFVQGGLNYFVTTKLAWNETNPFPHDLYYWEGIDGTRLLSHCFANVNNDLAEAWRGADLWRRYKGKASHATAMMTYGMGDGGGGPSLEMLERVAPLSNVPGLPKMTHGTAEGYFRSISSERLPVWSGEKYLEFHRGTFTAQARLKQGVRRTGHLLREAEIACVLSGGKYPAEQFSSLWTDLLRNQFHDILPGSCIQTVAEEACAELSAASSAAEQIRDDALQVASDRVSGGGLVVWNLSLRDRPLSLRFQRAVFGTDGALVFDGRPIPLQIEGDEVVVAAPEIMVPGLGYLSLSVKPGAASVSSPVRAGDTFLENEYLRVEVAADGTLSSLFDKVSSRELLAGRGNQVWAYSDLPRCYEAWEIDERYTEGGRELLASAPPALAFSGPLEAGISVARRAAGGEIAQTYRLRSGARRLEIVTKIVWTGRRTMLRALIPLDVHAHEAWFEAPFGAVPRPAHRNTSWDTARFEVPALSWVDFSEHGHGLGLINDGRHGHSVEHGTLGLTLLRAPIYPDPWADEGEHQLTYALVPHRGDRELLIAEAADLESPLIARFSSGGGGDLPRTQRLISVSPNARVELSALKLSEDGKSLVLRIFEPLGGRTRVSLSSPLFSHAVRSNFLEDIFEPLALDALEMRPYQVLTLRLSK